MQVRPTRKSDFPKIDALLALAYPRLLKDDYPPSLMVTAIPLIARAKPALIASGTYYIAEDDGGEALGCGGWTAHAPGTGRIAAGQGHIRHLATHPDQLRRGVGRAIMARIFSEARRAGMTHLSCLSTITAVPFYEACGFVRLGKVDVRLKEPIIFPAIEMALEL